MGDNVTLHDVVSGLGSLGVRPVAHLMVHASLSKFGNVVGGAQTIVGGLRHAAGAEGAVIAPSFRDAYRSDYYALRACRDGCPRQLCTSSERGYTGIIGETVREQKDAVRSCHPTHSWVGIGNHASFLLEGHRNSPTPCGRDSPFFRLMERDGVILLLGVGINSLTNMHAIEDVRNVPYLSAIDPPNRHATYTTSGKRIQYVFPDLLHRAIQDCGVIRTAQIGSATCHALPARQFGSFLWVITENDPWCLVLRPSGARYDPKDDAQQKTADMVRAWKADPDQSAWRKFLEASSRTVDAPTLFAPAANPEIRCPAFRGERRGHFRCEANDLPPWEKFEDFPGEPGVATCQHCNWGELNNKSNGQGDKELGT